MRHTKAERVLRRDSKLSRRRVWRYRNDRLVSYAVGLGGIAVLLTIGLIFFYLLRVVLPLFNGADLQAVASYSSSLQQSRYISLNEYNDIALAVDSRGEARFFSAKTGESLGQINLPIKPQLIASVGAASPSNGLFAYGGKDGSAWLFKQHFSVSYPSGNQRRVIPTIDYPLGEQAISLDPQGQAIERLSVQEGKGQTTLAAVTADQRLVLKRFIKQRELLDSGSEIITEQQAQLPLTSVATISHIRLNQQQHALYLADNTGRLYLYDVQDLQQPRLLQTVVAVPAGVSISSLEFLTGGMSILVGRSDGQIDQWFPVQQNQQQPVLQRVRSFEQNNAAIVAIAVENARKGFVALDQEGRLGIYHTTAQRRLLVSPWLANGQAIISLSPRADALIAMTDDGDVSLVHIDNPHPDISWQALWGKVWYEGRDQPEYLWQSSGADSDYESKLSLTPLTFGTIKAAFYAMLVAVPLAIMAAIYTAYFMPSGMRRWVKPTIELMEALPTVILGFLAGLWLAPLVENHLPGVFSLLLLMPLMFLLVAWGWTRLPQAWRDYVPDGWEAIILIPFVMVTAWLAMHFSASLELWLFNGNMPQFLDDLGIAYEQRNALVIGVAMGFAIIPTIFSITEDAIFSVPKHLTLGSLALGATLWQTLTRVVLLTASPAILSAVMLGFGRAVGETMIVLMATGNTPIMDFNVFESFRALSANIAMEMPEAAVASSHYRVLFLMALVLFLATFILNTLAELVRQRLRKKYSVL